MDCDAGEVDRDTTIYIFSILEIIKMQKLNDPTEIVETINKYCKEATPFIFIIDYLAQNAIISTLKEMRRHDVYCSINGNELNKSYKRTPKKSMRLLKIQPMEFGVYMNAFDKVLHEINKGNSYLLNLTFASKIEGDIDLKFIYDISKAPYKLYYKGEFIFYSPEPFIKIKGNKISSFPMKGTINASQHNADLILLDDEKEQREHYTIVDLIRNDMSKVATSVKVENLRYIEEVRTKVKTLLQTSSHISGILPENWRETFGEILFKMLPAGSITGAPKEKTIEIIAEAEVEDRGFYTGITGYFDGKDIDSCVNIRYIERREDDEYYYKSGGGITSLSDIEEEYNELAEKIYVPIF